jgi:WYL domain-containing protein
VEHPLTESLAEAAHWLLSTGGRPLTEGLVNALRGLPSHDPAPGVEVDIGGSGTEVRVRAAHQLSVSLVRDEVEVLRGGLAALAQAGVAAARGLLARLTAGEAEEPPAKLPEGLLEQPPASSLTIRLSPALGSWLRRRIEGLARERDGTVIASVELSAVEGISPWLLRLGPRIEIVGPREMRTLLANSARALAEHYRSEPLDIPTMSGTPISHAGAGA